MRITILCGSLEPGCDGVGDYSRRLADAANSLGHDILLVSLSDRNPTAEQIRSGLEIKRLNVDFSNQAAASEVIELIESWGAEAISLQFVPFSFHPKGLISKFIPFILKIRSGLRLHIMLHETWVRWEPGAKMRHQLLGQIQRLQILKALRSWKPECLHTSNKFYVNQLTRYDIHVAILPLFGNIPINTSSEIDDFEALFETPFHPDERRIIFPFNQDSKWRPLRLLNRIHSIAKPLNTPIRLIQVGRVHSECGHWREISDFAKKHGWHCDQLGPQNSDIISIAFRSSHLGISAGSIQLARKSGAVLSMLEHGLPVLCTSPSNLSDWAEYNESRLLAYEVDDETVKKLLFDCKQATPKSELDDVASQWLEDITG